MDTLAIIKRIEHRLVEIGMGKAEFYEKTGISSASFSQWNTGKFNPSKRSLEKAAECLGVTYDYLLSESDTPAPDIGFDDFTYAMQNESKNLSPESKERLLQMARFFAEEERKKGR